MFYGEVSRDAGESAVVTLGVLAGMILHEEEIGLCFFLWFVRVGVEMSSSWTVLLLSVTITQSEKYIGCSGCRVMDLNIPVVTES